MAQEGNTVNNLQYTTQASIRKAFWEQHPQFTRKGRQTQNSYPVDVRLAFVDFRHNLLRNGNINDKIYNLVTL